MGSTSSPVRGSVVESKSASRPGSVQRKLEFSRTATESLRNRIDKNRSKPKRRPSEYKSADLANGRHLNSTSATKSDDDEEIEDISFVERESIDHIEVAQHNKNESEGLSDESDKITEDEDQPIRANKMDKETTSRKPPRPKEWRNKFGEVRGSSFKDTGAEKQESLPKSHGSHIRVRENAVQKKKGSSRKTALNQEFNEENRRLHKRSRNSSDEISSSEGEVEKSNVQTTKTMKRLKKNEYKLSESKSTSAQLASSLSQGDSRPKGKRSATGNNKLTSNQSGPPLPKSRGLVILRREDDKILKTRSGRNSIRPLAFWSNEKIEFEDEELPIKDLTADFAGRKIKHVVRAEITEPVKKSRIKTHSSKVKKRKRAKVSASDDDDSNDDNDQDLEPWEVDPGRIIAEVRTWDQDDTSGSQIGEREEEIAVSSTAIITRDIANASFRFAKTLTLPFFGAGMVDLPPGSEKKQKNSRKMQMAFFVFYGKVQVTVNDNVFRISKGGMWQVPRGNFYGIQNDYDKPARIFFSQGCENEEVITDS